MVPYWIIEVEWRLNLTQFFRIMFLGGVRNAEVYSNTKVGVYQVLMILSPEFWKPILILTPDEDLIY